MFKATALYTIILEGKSLDQTSNKEPEPSPSNFELNKYLAKFFCALCLVASIVTSSCLFASDLKEHLPIAGGRHLQEHGWAGISFFYSVSNPGDKQVKIQISTSSKFTKIEREFYPKGQSYFWRCEMTGKIYWRLVLQAKDGKTLATTPVKSFVVVPPPVTTMPLTQGAPQKFSPRGLDFQWSEAGPRVTFYRFKLAKDKTFDHPLINTDIKRHSYHVDKLDSGHYFWKVGVKYNRNVPIVYSAIREFIVQPPAKPAVAVIPNSDDLDSDDTLDTHPAPPPAPKSATAPPSKADPTAGGGAVKTDADEEETPETRGEAQAPVAPMAVPPSSPAPPPPPPLPPPEPPELVQPSDQARIETLSSDKSLMLQWNAGPEVRKFLVEIAKNPEFTDATRVNCEPMRLSVTLQPGRFFWRVTATDGRGQKSGLSAVRSFELVQKKITVGLLSPDKDHQFTYSKKPPPRIFSWQVTASKNDALIYRLQISRESSFGEIVVQRELKGESIAIDDLADGNYFWRVGAQIAKDAPLQFSESSPFNIVKKVSLAPAPQLMAPADGARLESAGKELSLTLRWSPPPIFGGFIIELATNASFAGAEKFSTMEPSLDLKKASGHYFWRVGTLDEGREEGPFSPPRSFSVAQASQSIQLTEPAAGAAVGTFTVDFSWQPQEGCVSYHLTVSATGTMADPLRELETKETKLQTKLDDEDTYFWTVKCSTADGQTIQGATQSFRILIHG